MDLASIRDFYAAREGLKVKTMPQMDDSGFGAVSFLNYLDQMAEQALGLVDDLNGTKTETCEDEFMLSLLPGADYSVDSLFELAQSYYLRLGITLRNDYRDMGLGLSFEKAPSLILHLVISQCGNNGFLVSETHEHHKYKLGDRDN